MKEISEDQLKALLTQPAFTVIFIYSPLCGTCQVARRMLTIVSELLPEMNFTEINIFSIPQYVQQWQIESVPCVLLMNKGDLLKKVYAVRSVDYLYTIFKETSQDYSRP